MGVADSSLLNSVHELSSALSVIERKIATVEDFHLHTERTICHDGEIIISTKRILCNPNIRLLLGPVIGLITYNSVRILLESSSSGTITCNVFEVNESSEFKEGCFLKTETFETVAGVPIATSIYGLSSNTRYAIYFGGISGEDVILKNAIFSTLPFEKDFLAGEINTDKSPLRMLCAYKGRVNTGRFPGESDLWENMNDTVILNASIFQSVQRDFTNVEVESEVSGDDCIVRSAKSVHMIIHTGDFVSVEGIVRSRGLQLLDLINRDDVTDDAIEETLMKTEQELKDAYRRAFSDKSTELILRRCGHLFISGIDESAMAAISLLAVGHITPPKVVHEKSKKKKKQTVATTKGKKGLSSKGSKKSDTEDEMEIEKEKKYDENGILYDAKIDSRAVGGAIRTSRESLLAELTVTAELQDERTRSIVSTLLRLVRRIFNLFMRQLWDVRYSELALADAKDENIHRRIAALSRGVERKRKLCTELEKTRRKLVAEFGEDYFASYKVNEHFKIASEALTVGERALREVLTDSDCITGTWTDAHPPEAVLDLGSCALLLFDLNWGWLMPDGSLQPGATPTREVGVNPRTMAELEGLLGRGGNGSKSSILRVLCVFPCGLFAEDRKRIDTSLSTTASAVFTSSEDLFTQTRAKLSALPASSSQSFYLPDTDIKRLLVLLASWQQEEVTHAALLLSANTDFCGHGWVFPKIPQEINSQSESLAVTNGSESTDKTMDKSLEDMGWNIERSRLRHVAVGGMSMNPRLYMQPSHTGMTSLCSSDSHIGFDSEFTFTSGFRSFWDITVFHPTHYNSDTKVLGKPAGFNLKNVSSKDPPLQLSIGPVIGKVTTSTAAVLVESVLEVTRRVTELRRFIRGGSPAVFSFDGLTANRLHEVCVSPMGVHSQLGRRVQWSQFSEESIFKASFTTHESTEFSDSSFYTLSEAKSTSQRTKSVSTGSTNGPVKLPRRLFRILLVGPNRPLWSIHNSLSSVTDTPSRDTDEFLLDRLMLTEAHTFCRKITSINQRGWGCGADLVVHTGGNVDLSFTLDQALTTLAQAELEKIPARQQALLKQGASQLRNAYRLHWGTSVSRAFLSSASNLMVSDSMLDILGATNSLCPRHLIRDLTPFTVQYLRSMIAELESEYQSSLWFPDTSASVNKPMSEIVYIEERLERIRRVDRPSYHYVCDGDICIFTLNINISIPNQGTENGFHNGFDNLVSESQIQELEGLLLPNITYQSVSGSPIPKFKSFILVSPLPLISGDPSALNFSLERNAYRPTAFTANESGRILDILGLWLDSADAGPTGLVSGSSTTGGREAVVIAGGSSHGFKTVIEGSRISDAGGIIRGRGAGKTASTMATVRIQQLCVGPFVSTSITLDDQHIRSGNVVGAIFKFQVVHSNSLFRPHCGFISINLNGSETAVQDSSSSSSKMGYRINCVLADSSDIDLLEPKESDDVIPENIRSAWLQLSSFLDLHLPLAGDKQTTQYSDGSTSHTISVEDIFGEDVGRLASSHASTLLRTCEKNMGVFEKCHQEFCSNRFGQLSAGGSASSDIISAIVNYCFQELVLTGQLDEASSELLVRPTRFVANSVWTDFCLFFASGSRFSISASDYRGYSNTNEQVGNGLLTGSFQLFYSLVSRVMLASCILELCAFEQNMLENE